MKLTIKDQHQYRYKLQSMIKRLSDTELVELHNELQKKYFLKLKYGSDWKNHTSEDLNDVYCSLLKGEA